MKRLAQLALCSVLALPAFAADLVVSSTEHTEAGQSKAGKKPPPDKLETLWIGKDRVRRESGTRVSIVRADKKELLILDTRAKTYCRVALPIVLEKHVRADLASALGNVSAGFKATVTPTTETKKIQDWNTTRYTVSLKNGQSTSTEELWVTKDLGVDGPAVQEMLAALASAETLGVNFASEMKKIDGLVVYSESKGKVFGADSTTTMRVMAIEKKEPPEGFYDAPKDFVEKPFDLLAKEPGPAEGDTPPPHLPGASEAPKRGDKPADKPADKPKPGGG